MKTSINIVLEATSAAFAEAVSRGDAPAAAAVYGDEAKLLAPGCSMLEGRAEIERFWLAGIERGLTGIKLQTLERADAGGTAFEVGRYWLWIQPDHGKWRSDHGKYVLLHRQHPDESWSWAVHVFNSDTSADSFPSASQGELQPPEEQ